MIESDVLHVILLVTKTLDALGVPYVIGGCIASIIHGLIRTTMDVNIVADLRLEQVSSLLAELKDGFYVDEQMIREAIKYRSSFNFIHLSTMFKVDIFLPKERPFDQQQLNRRITERVDPRRDELIWVLSAEDIVLANLDWFRLGGEVCERQWRDILGVLKTRQSALDIDYLRQWAQTLDVADLMERVLEELTDS